MSKKKNRRNSQRGNARSNWNVDVESKKLEQNLNKYFDELEKDPNSKIECKLCNHSAVDHDDHGCLLCFPHAGCDMKSLVSIIGSWRVTITEENIKAEKINGTNK